MTANNGGPTWAEIDGRTGVMRDRKLAEGQALWGDGSTERPHAISIRPVRRVKGKVAKFEVLFRGGLIGAWRDPEFSTCRALLAMGHTGRLVTQWEGRDTIAMRVDIERAARMTVSETDAGPRLVRWRPFNPPAAEIDDQDSDCFGDASAYAAI